jgi:hypothetical protein
MNLDIRVDLGSQELGLTSQIKDQPIFSYNFNASRKTNKPFMVTTLSGLNEVTIHHLTLQFPTSDKMSDQRLCTTYNSDELIS